MPNEHDVVLAIMNIGRADVDPVVTFTNGSDVVNLSGHGFIAGDGPFQFSNSGGALPAELSISTDYWVVETVTTNTFQIAASQGGAAIDFTDDGSGTTTITGTGRLAGSTGMAGKDVPIVQFADLARADDEGAITEHKPPIVSVTTVTGDAGTGTTDFLATVVQVDAWANRRSEGLDAQMMDRVEQILTGPNFTTEGLDVGVSKGQRRRLDEFESGRKRLSQDYFLLVRR